MGKRGPAATPTEVNRLRGFPGHRPINAGEPKPAAAASIAAPPWLDGESSAIWEDLAPELHRLGLLKTLDVAVLAGACRWWAIYRKADRALRRGLVQTTKAVGQTRRPEVGIAKEAFEAAVRVFQRFGVTPSERTKLTAPAAKAAGDDHGHGQPPVEPLDELARRRAARTAHPA